MGSRPFLAQIDDGIENAGKADDYEEIDPVEMGRAPQHSQSAAPGSSPNDLLFSHKIWWAL
jgi:hypothetical protein